MSYTELMEILCSKPKYLSTPEDELPVFIKRVKVLANPLTKLKFEPNKVSRLVFEHESLYDAVKWRLLSGRINHKLFTGETGEGKTSIAITLALMFSNMKRQYIKAARNLPPFRIDIDQTRSNFLLGQFLTLRSQLLFDKYKRYEEVIVDEFELCCNRMRSASGQNLDTKNTLDAGRFRYNPISGICPSIGSIDKEVSSTKMHWNIISEFNRGKKKREVEVIVKYNVHSRDNYEYRWVTFIEMVVAWCPSELYHQAEEIKRKMIATAEGLKSTRKHYAEEMERIQKRKEKEEDRKADKLVQKYLNGEITREECIIKIYTTIKTSKNYIADRIPKTSWNTVAKVIKRYEKSLEEGTLTEEERKEVID